MYDKHNKTIIKASEQNEVYIVKHIVKNLIKFVLISAVHTSHSETAFSAAASDVSLHNIMINSSDIDTVSLNEKVKAYRL